jgi:hypothetical protein
LFKLKRADSQEISLQGRDAYIEHFAGQVQEIGECCLKFFDVCGGAEMKHEVLPEVEILGREVGPAV